MIFVALHHACCLYLLTKQRIFLWQAGWVCWAVIFFYQNKNALCEDHIPKYMT